MQSKKLLVTLVTMLAFAAGAGNAAADSWSATVTDAATATSATAPASSNNGQSANQSIGTVQLGQTNVSPATAANAGNVNANAPINVLSNGSGNNSSAEQSNSASAETGSNQNGSSGGQSANQSIGTVQLGQTNISPATAANIGNVNANAPINVLSNGSGNNSSAEQSNSASAKTETRQTSGNHHSGCGCSRQPAGQSANQSIGTVQLGQTNISPATAANAGNVNANAPISLLGSWGGCGCSHHAEQEAEQSNTASAETATSQSGGNHPGGCGCSWQPAGQSANQSIGTVQLGQTNVSPATAANAGSATAASAVTVVGRSRRTGSGLPGMGVAGLLLATRVGRGQRAAAKRVLAAGRGGGVLPFTGLSLLILGVLGLVVSTSGCLVRKAVSVRSIS